MLVLNLSAPLASPGPSTNPLAVEPWDHGAALPNPTTTSAHNAATSEDTMPDKVSSFTACLEMTAPQAMTLPRSPEPTGGRGPKHTQHFNSKYRTATIIHLKIHVGMINPPWCGSWTKSYTIWLNGLSWKKQLLSPDEPSINHTSRKKNVKTISQIQPSNHQPPLGSKWIVIPSNKVTSGLSTRIVVGITYQGVAWHQQRWRCQVIHLCTLNDRHCKSAVRDVRMNRLTMSVWKIVTTLEDLSHFKRAPISFLHCFGPVLWIEGEHEFDASGQCVDSKPVGYTTHPSTQLIHHWRHSQVCFWVIASDKIYHQCGRSLKWVEFPLKKIPEWSWSGHLDETFSPFIWLSPPDFFGEESANPKTTSTGGFKLPCALPTTRMVPHPHRLPSFWLGPRLRRWHSWKNDAFSAFRGKKLQELHQQ